MNVYKIKVDIDFSKDIIGQYKKIDEISRNHKRVVRIRDCVYFPKIENAENCYVEFQENGIKCKLNYKVATDCPKCFIDNWLKLQEYEQRNK